MSLQEFTSKIKNAGLARTNQFAVIFNPPAGVGAGATARDIQLLCSGVSLPGVNTKSQLIQLPWKTFDNPVNNEYPNINMTFYVDGSMNIKNMFDIWMSAIWNPRTGSVGWRDEYITNVQIWQKDIAENVLYEVVLENAFPVAIGDVIYTYQHGSPIVELTVSFSYDVWINERIDLMGPMQGRDLSWIERAQQTLGKVLGIYQGVKNTYGNVTGTVKRVGDYGRAGVKSKSVDGAIGGAAGGLGSLGNLGNIFRR